MPLKTRAFLTARRHANKLLYGLDQDTDEEDGTHDRGLWGQKLQALSQANETLKLIQWDRELQCACGHGNPSDGDPFVAARLAERKSYLDEADRIAEEIAAIERLVDPDLMSTAFEMLEAEFRRTSDVAAFIDAALVMRKDYGVYRGLGKEAQALSRQISDLAIQLARLIRRLRDTGVGLPKILLPQWGGPHSDWESIHGPPELKYLKTRRYISALMSREPAGTPAPPDLRKLLVELSEVCSAYQPDFMDQSISSALSSRQQSRKSASLRAFATALRCKKIKLTPPVMKAMSIAANAVMNDPNDGIAEDHVRKAVVSMAKLQRKATRRRSLASEKSQLPKRVTFP